MKEILHEYLGFYREFYESLSQLVRKFEETPRLMEELLIIKGKIEVLEELIEEMSKNEKA